MGLGQPDLCPQLADPVWRQVLWVLLAVGSSNRDGVQHTERFVCHSRGQARPFAGRVDEPECLRQVVGQRFNIGGRVQHHPAVSKVEGEPLRLSFGEVVSIHHADNASASEAGS